jgi:DNA-directed RNA polymerase subunit RPC12/RpoP
MAGDIVTVGYTCSQCGKRVEVLRSSAIPNSIPREIVATCKCGKSRLIRIHEIQLLEVWKEKATEAV